MSAHEQNFDISLLMQVGASIGRELGSISVEELMGRPGGDLRSVGSIHACVGLVMDGKTEPPLQSSLVISLKGAGVSCPPISGIIQEEDPSRRRDKDLGSSGSARVGEGHLTDDKTVAPEQTSRRNLLRGAWALCPPSISVIKAEDLWRRSDKDLGSTGSTRVGVGSLMDDKKEAPKQVFRRRFLRDVWASFPPSFNVIGAEKLSRRFGEVLRSSGSRSRGVGLFKGSKAGVAEQVSSVILLRALGLDVCRFLM